MLSLLALWLSLVTAALAGSCHFTLELTWAKGSPDGYERNMIFVNGQYPGPLLEIEQDDWVEIEVINHLPFNTSIHYHGTLYFTFNTFRVMLIVLRYSSDKHTLGRWCAWPNATPNSAWCYLQI